MEALIRWRRPFRARDAAKNGIDPVWLSHLVLPQVKRLERGVYGDRQVTFPRIAIALVRVRASFACLCSALWLHGLLDAEPPEAWVCIRHKAWKPDPPLVTPTRIVRTSLWPLEEDFVWTASGLPMTGVARTVIDFFRYKRLVTASAGPAVLAEVLESGKCTLAEIDACAERYRIRRWH